MSSKIESNSTLSSSVYSGNLWEIIKFMDVQREAMLSLQLQAGKMMDILYQNSDMTSNDISNETPFFFPKQIRKDLFRKDNKSFYIQSSPYFTEFKCLIDLYYRFLEQFRYYSAIVMPLVHEISQLLLSEEERSNHKEHLDTLEEAFDLAIVFYRMEFMKQKKRTSCKVQN